MASLLFGRRGRLALVVLAAVVVQGPVLDKVQVARAHPDVLLLLPVLAGLVMGPNTGAWIGFFAGLAADLPLPSAFGVSAMVFTLTGFAVGSIVQALLEGPWWVIPLTGAVGTAIGELLYVGVGTSTGQDVVLHDPLALMYVIAVASLANAVLSLPVALALRWANGDDEPAVRLGVRGAA